jgi:ATP-dependent RNA helicase DDX35
MSKLQFWKPGTIGPGSSLDRATEAEGNLVPSAPSYSELSVQSQRERLPIFKHRMFAIVTSMLVCSFLTWL